MSTPELIDLHLEAGVLHAPFAGSILTADGPLPLVIRYGGNAVTADGRLVIIERPEEWMEPCYPAWRVLPLDQLAADRMAAACGMIELMLDLPRGTLSAESLQPALAVAAACCSGTLYQLRRRLGPWG